MMNMNSNQCLTAAMFSVSCHLYAVILEDKWPMLLLVVLCCVGMARGGGRGVVSEVIPTDVRKSYRRVAGGAGSLCGSVFSSAVYQYGVVGEEITAVYRYVCSREEWERFVMVCCCRVRPLRSGVQ